MQLDKSTIEYLTYLINHFQSEIDVNMSFLNCHYTKTVQLLAKYFLHNVQIEEMDDMLAEAFLTMSSYYIDSFEAIFKEQYEKKYFDCCEYMSSENAHKKVKNDKFRHIEEMKLQHRHLQDLIGGKDANI